MRWLQDRICSEVLYALPCKCPSSSALMLVWVRERVGSPCWAMPMHCGARLKPTQTLPCLPEQLTLSRRYSRTCERCCAVSVGSVVVECLISLYRNLRNIPFPIHTLSSDFRDHLLCFEHLLNNMTAFTDVPRHGGKASIYTGENIVPVSELSKVSSNTSRGSHDATITSNGTHCEDPFELSSQYAYTPRKIRVITIGAGFSGLIMAHKFQHRFPAMRAIVEHKIFESRSDVGGTWLANHYPGVQCDVPAHIYVGTSYHCSNAHILTIAGLSFRSKP